MLHDKLRIFVSCISPPKLSKEKIHPSLSFCSVLCYTTAPLLQATGTFSKIMNPQKQLGLGKKESLPLKLTTVTNLNFFIDKFVTNLNSSQLCFFKKKKKCLPVLFSPKALMPARPAWQNPMSRDRRLVTSSNSKIRPSKMHSSDRKMIMANAEVQINFEWQWSSQYWKAKSTAEKKN